MQQVAVRSAVNQQFFGEVWNLSARSLRNIVRLPANALPSLFIPLFFFIVNSEAFASAIEIPGFTAGSYKLFAAPVAVTMAVFTSAGDAGFAMIADLLSGYFDKLRLAPIHRSAILLGRVLPMGLRAALQALLIILIAWAFGAPVATGVAGSALIMVLSAVFGMAWSCIGIIIALRTRNAQATNASFLLFFPFMFLTTSAMPKELLTGWFKAAVTINPITYILEGIRSLMVRGYDWTDVSRAFWISVLLLALTGAGALASFRKAVK